MAFYSLLLVSFGAILTAVRGAQEGPVTKVVQLLNLMEAKLTLDQKEDDEIQVAMECWCNKTKAELEADIDESEEEIEKLKNAIQEGEKLVAEATDEIRTHDDQLEQLKTTNRQTYGLRSQQHAIFVESEKELTEIIAAVNAAIVALRKHNPTAKAVFLDLPATRLRPLASLLVEHADTLNRLITPSQREELLLFTKSQLRLGKMFVQPYESQSGEVYGTLTQMLEQFQTKLADLRDTENSQANETEIAMNSGLEEAQKTQEQIDVHTLNRANNEKEVALHKFELARIEKVLEADKESLVDEHESCAASEEKHKRRKEIRDKEIRAVSQAADQLSGNRDLFARTFNPSFFQARLVKELPEQVWDADSRGEEFGTFITHLKELIGDLEVEMQEDTDEKDKCTEKQHSASMSLTSSTRRKDEMLAEQAELEKDVERLIHELKGLAAAASALEELLTKRSEMRVEENSVFQAIVDDQSTTKSLLEAAKGVLLGFYGERTSLVVEFAQQKHLSMAHDAPEKPRGFDGEYERHPQSENVIDTIQEVIDDITVMLAEAKHDEAENQHLYERFVQDTNSALKTNEETKVSLETKQSEAENDLGELTEELNDHIGTMEQEKSNFEEGNTHCEHVLKNFDANRKAMEEELESYRRAIHILSGADFRGGAV